MTSRKTVKFFENKILKERGEAAVLLYKGGSTNIPPIILAGRICCAVNVIHGFLRCPDLPVCERGLFAAPAVFLCVFFTLFNLPPLRFIPSLDEKSRGKNVLSYNIKYHAEL
jgi:hypothetical protein